jgi:cytochrome c biogenesis protein CcmG/thiol:disulfide interchange protein DsbE
MSRHFRWPLVFVTAVSLAGCASAATPTASRADDSSLVGGRLPTVALKDFEGRPLDAATLKGKVILLDIWASWCAPCKEELPLLDQMAARLSKRGVLILAVSIDESRDEARAFLATHAGSWSLALAHDPDGKIAERLHPPKMPTSYIVDRAGVIRHVNAGFQREDAPNIEAKLSALSDES